MDKSTQHIDCKSEIYNEMIILPHLSFRSGKKEKSQLGCGVTVLLFHIQKGKTG